MPNPLRAIVVDANAFGRRAEPNVELIVSWVNACVQHDAELWIPEVVAWEMAEHVLAAITEAEEGIAAYNTRRRKWGLPLVRTPGRVAVEDILETLEDAGVVLVPLDGKSARAAVRDQTLQTGTGSRKDDVKTGAADSAWLRSVRRHNGGSFDDLILVTADSAAMGAIGAMFGGDQPRVAGSLHALRPMLEEEREATEPQLRAFVDTVNAKLPDTTDLLYAAGVDRRNWWRPDGFDHDFQLEWEEQNSGVTVIGAVEYLGGGMYDGWSDSVRALVRIPVSVEEQYVRQDAWGDVPEYTMATYQAWLDAETTVYLNSHTEHEPALDDDLELVDLGVDEDTFELVPI